MRFRADVDSFSSGAIPTNEDVLDINFRSIVSDLRAIISGTLGPRSYSSLQSGWQYAGEVQRAPTRRKYIQADERRMERVRVKNMVSSMASILCANCPEMTREEALVKARQLLGVK